MRATLFLDNARRVLQMHEVFRIPDVAVIDALLTEDGDVLVTEDGEAIVGE